MDQSAEQERQQQCADHPAPHRTALVEHQHNAGNQQRGRHKPEAVAKQPLEQITVEGDKHRLNMEIAKGGKDGQQEAHQCANLAAHGLRLSFVLSGILPLCGGAPLFCRGLAAAGGRLSGLFRRTAPAGRAFRAPAGTALPGAASGAAPGRRTRLGRFAFCGRHNIFLSNTRVFADSDQRTALRIRARIPAPQQ